jgi:hypothetical protein
VLFVNSVKREVGSEAVHLARGTQDYQFFGLLVLLVVHDGVQGVAERLKLEAVVGCEHGLLVSVVLVSVDPDNLLEVQQDFWRR